MKKGLSDRNCQAAGIRAATMPALRFAVGVERKRGRVGTAGVYLVYSWIQSLLYLEEGVGSGKNGI
ncbi:hypothetical protein OB13_13215 [Pontibacter sp. HJ8]